MIFSRMAGRTGQASLESTIGLGVLVTVSFIGIFLFLKGIGTLVLTKWAAQNSICIARQVDPRLCEQQTRNELVRYFALRHVEVQSKVTAGVIHSRLSGEWVDQTRITGSYDLGASEYKRISE